MRRLLATLLLAAAAAMPLPPARAQAEAATQAAVSRDWALFKSRFLTEEGRVVDDVNGAVSHSEGQGYGLLAAVAADDRPAFDRMLSWTDEQLFVREDELAAWRWDPKAEPHVEDLNNASDGDLLIAWALFRAGKRWNEPAFGERAKAILEALGAETLAPSRFGTVLLPGAEGFDVESRPDGPVINLSYWIFPALSELDGVTPAFPAGDIAASGLAILEATAARRPGVAPDWTSLGGAAPAPADGFARESGYNAVRVPLYLAWEGGARELKLLAPWSQAWRGEAGVLPAVIALPKGKRTVLDDPNYAALAGLLDCAAGGRPPAPGAAFAPTNYYPSILYLLTRMTLAERYPQCA
jgi:endoglucanase